jgi:hypothetical protein
MVYAFFLPTRLWRWNRQCSETLAHKLQTPVNNPEESISCYEARTKSALSWLISTSSCWLDVSNDETQLHVLQCRKWKIRLEGRPSFKGCYCFASVRFLILGAGTSTYIFHTESTSALCSNMNQNVKRISTLNLYKTVQEVQFSKTVSNCLQNQKECP